MANETPPKYKQWAAAGIGLLALLTLYLLYQTTRAEVPGALIPRTPPERIGEDEQALRARTWLQEARDAAATPEYGEGDVDPELRGVTLEPQTMYQGRREEEEKPEILPEPLAAVLAAVNVPFRRTFEAYESFVLRAEFLNSSAESERGAARTVGKIRFAKDREENWHAVYDVLSDAPTERLADPLYRSQFWLIGNQAFIKRPDTAPSAVTQNSPVEDQELLNKVTSNELDLLSHEMLRKFVNEAKFGIGYEKIDTDRWEGRPVDVYAVVPPHYGDNPGFEVHSREGYIWLDRETNLPLRVNLSYSAKMSIPSGYMLHYDVTNKIQMEITSIGTAPQVLAPEAKD